MSNRSKKNNADSTGRLKSSLFPPERPIYPIFEKYNPFREPAWRWRRAQQIVADGGAISAKTDDAWTRRGAKYLMASASCKNDRSDAALLRRAGNIVVAQQLSEEDVVRWMVEAELLADVPIADVARKAGVNPAAIVAYVKLFFDVLDRLKCGSYIYLKVLGMKYVRNMLTLDDMDVLLKMFAYYGGPILLKNVAPYILHPGVDLSLLSPFHQEFGPKIRRLLAFETTRFTWPTDKQSKKLMKQSEPPSLDDMQKMMCAAIARGDSVLRPLKSKSPCIAVAESSETDKVARCLAAGVA